MWAKDKVVKKLYIKVLEKNKNAMNLYNKKGFKDFEKKLELDEDHT